MNEPLTPEQIADLYYAEFSPLNDLPVHEARKRIAEMIREYAEERVTDAVLGVTMDR